MSIRFELLARSRRTGARLGRVHTPHGWFDTPAFMPVGTRGSVKGLFPADVAATGAQIILGNTYHLLLRPGAELIERRGGLQRFTNWRGPMLTDSGGYQAYSLADTNRVDDHAVTFKSIVDGSTIVLTPERAIAVQNQLGADIIMALDDCPPSVDPAAAPVRQQRLRTAVARDSAGFESAHPSARAKSGSTKRATGYDHAKRLDQANHRTVRWLERCRAEHQRLGGYERRSLFGIVQGGTDLDARTWCANAVTNIELPGYAIGGVAVGEQSDEIGRVVRHTTPLLPERKPRYLMGVGYDRDLITAVLAGVDMFDCVLPTRNGRNACAFVPVGTLRLRNAAYAEDDRPLEVGCDCGACAPKSSAHVHLGAGSDPVHLQGTFTRAYIRHLFLSGEMLGPILVSLHNLRFYQRLMLDLRRTIINDDWESLAARWPGAIAGFGTDPAVVVHGWKGAHCSAESDRCSVAGRGVIGAGEEFGTRA